MTKDSITLTLRDGTWMARFDGPKGTEIRRLFGTNTVPTPYTARTIGTTVQAAVGRLNPNVAVYLA